ncbi:LysR family transcriptional regulator [Rhizobium sp. LCM 4573]|uniref:LysR family transcriptional regulator n=1 Tax=Rhizobium sp. LCM 4573 TaxID=1848291 RepID=UPI0008D8E440|nr:LysR substrate-binding domain-containing protein [Rhizobium sp. LCM 4573]OHV80520.1 transcriptional regulator [Rhizobium sp. LCM 4573]
MLDLRRLRYLVAIADCGSMSAAARQLGIAQPALSHHITELERLVGFPVLHRLARGVQATEKGELLLSHARAIVERVRQAETEIRAIGELDERVIRLSLVPSWATAFTPRIISEVAAFMPKVFLRVIEARNEESLRLISLGRVDMAVALVGAADAADDLIVNESLFAVSAKPIGKSIPLNAAAKLDLILPPRDNPLRVSIDNAAERAGISLNVTMEIDGQDTIKRAVSAGMGASILSWNSIRQEYEAGQLKAAHIVDPVIYRSVHLLRSKDMDDRTFILFRDLLRKVAGPGASDL